MVEVKNYMNEEVVNIVNKIDEVCDKFDGVSWHIRADLNDINGATNITELMKVKERIEESGFGCIDRVEKAAERKIENTKKEIEELLAAIEKEEEKLELCKALRDTSYDDILEKMVEDREKELCNVEWMEYWQIKKGSEYLNSRAYDFSKKVVIEAKKMVVEKGNWHNTKTLYEGFKIDWKDRTRLADELKARGAKNLVVQEGLRTKKLESEFQIYE